MKKIILTVVALSAFGWANAQQFKFGPKAGINISTFTGDDVSDDVSMKIGFHIGGVAEMKLTDKFSIQPELLVSFQGAETEYRENYFFDDDYYLYENKLNLIYVNIPVMAKYYIVKGFNVEAGPQLGILVSAKNKQEITSNVGGISYNESETVDVKDGFKTVDFGVNIGAGYDFPNGIFVGARYTVGLSNVEDSGDAKNAVIGISGGFKF